MNVKQTRWLRSPVWMAATAGIALLAIALLFSGCQQDVTGPAGGMSAAATRPAEVARVLRISADPNNLPFTNDRGEGFENKIAELIARETGARIEYIWRAQRRGFFRHSLKEGECDLVLGVPAGFEMALTTAPYYRSTYVFVQRKDLAEKSGKIASLDDPRLREVKIGVPYVGGDGVNSPPLHALARRGITSNIVGYSLYSDYRQPNPPRRLLEAVAKGDVDVAVAWGPLAGYFARHSEVSLVVTAVSPQTDGPLPMTFAISMGVQKGNTALRDELNAVLNKRQAEVERILDEYGVPRVTATQTAAAEGGGR